MNSKSITLEDQKPVKLPLQSGGILSLEYCCGKEALSDSEDTHHADTRRTALADLEDFARRGDLKRFAETDLIQDGVRWEVVCKDAAEPGDQALAVFTIYNRRGEKGLKQLRRRIKDYKRAPLY